MKTMVVLVVLLLAGVCVYYLLKSQGAFGAQAELDTVVKKETPFWQKLLGAGAEQYRSEAFDPGEFIRDVTSL